MSIELGTIFQQRLVETRKLRRMNQEALAKAANLASTAISHFESGNRKPSFDNLRKLADALGVTLDYLMGRSDDLQNSAPKDLEDAAMFRDYGNLSQADREFARKFMSDLAERNKTK